MNTRYIYIKYKNIDYIFSVNKYYVTNTMILSFRTIFSIFIVFFLRTRMEISFEKLEKAVL